MKTFYKKVISTLFLLIFAVMSAGIITASAASSEAWVLQSATNMRKSYSTDSSIITTIGSGTKITVTEKKTDSNYVWGKIKYNGETGWLALNYSKYKSGSLCNPDITNTEKTFKGIATLKWKSVPSANKYTLTIYDAKGNKYKSYSTASTSYSVALSSGSYKARVKAQNSTVSSWSATGDYYSFSITSPNVTSVKISGSSTVVKGKSVTLKVALAPTDIKDKSVAWSSSNTKVITVSSKGVVKGVSYGEAYAVCKANSGKVSDKFKISVIPTICATPVWKSATDTSVTFSWSAVSDVSGYQIYVLNTSTKKYVYADSTATASYTLTNQKAGSNVSVKIRAYVTVGSKKLYGKFSDTAILPLRTAAPVGLEAAGSTSDSVSFTWDKIDTASMYVIYKYDSEAKSYKKVGTTSAVKYTVSASAGEHIKVRVRAIKAYNSKEYYSNYSDALSLFSCPSAPKVTAVTSGNDIKLSWSRITGATCYQIEYAVGSEKSYKTFTYTNSAMKNCTISSLADGTYYFRVRAYITNGDTTTFGDWSEAVCINL